LTTMGIDATKPFGEAFEDVARVPGSGDIPEILKSWMRK